MQSATRISDKDPESRSRTAEFHYVPNFQGKGPRVIVLVGPHWTDVMRGHYGIQGDPFYLRAAIAAEPSKDSTGHPWGWVSKPKEMLLDEQRWSDPQTMKKLSGLLEEQIERHQSAFTC